MSDERFAPVADWPGYRVSTAGRVQTQRHRNGLPSDTWRDLTPVPDGQGYPQVRLYRAGQKPKWMFVSRLVLMAFVGPPPTPDAKARHVNDPDPMNNHVDNLAWGTQTENCADKERHGTAQKGDQHPRAKLTEPDVRAIRARHEAGERLFIIARDYPQVRYGTVRSVAVGESWHCSGTKPGLSAA